MSEPMKLKCPHCNQAIQATWSSCRNCGQQLSTQAPNRQEPETVGVAQTQAPPEKKGFLAWLNGLLKR